MGKQHHGSRIHRRYISVYLFGVLFFISDLVVIYFSFWLGTNIRQALIPLLGGIFYWPMYKPIAYLCMGYVAVLFSFSGLYPGYGKTAVKEIENTSKLLTLVFLILGGTTFLIGGYDYFPRSVFFITWAMSIILVPSLRFLIRNRTFRFSWYGIPILFVTDGTERESTITALQNCRRMGWNPIAIYSLDNAIQELEYRNIPIIQSWEEFLDIKLKNKVQISLFSAEDNQANLLLLRKISEEFNIVTLIVPYFNLGSLWVKPRDLEGRLGLEITYHLLDDSSRYMKRFIDIVGSIILLVLLSPIFLILSISILIESSAPVIFQQNRLGRDGKIYSAIKFRSMINDSEEFLFKLLQKNPSAKAEYKKFHKLKKDPRVTKVGNFIRRYSLDELPQLWNVLRGDMSLIGPRAYMASELEDIGEYKDIIFRVRPGITGWWQVMGRQNTDFQTRLKMDEYYISNWSLWMDLYIFYKTFWVVLRGSGA